MLGLLKTKLNYPVEVEVTSYTSSIEDLFRLFGLHIYNTPLLKLRRSLPSLFLTALLSFRCVTCKGDRIVSVILEVLAK